jgi:hypothetical protein
VGTGDGSAAREGEHCNSSPGPAVLQITPATTFLYPPLSAPMIGSSAPSSALIQSIARYARWIDMGYLFCNFFGSGIIINGGIPRGAFMNLKLIVAILVIVAMPAYAQPKKPSAPPKKPSATNVTTDAQKVVKIISGDKARTQTYCDIGKLGDQIEEAEQKKDMNKIDELNKKMDELATKLGPEYAALMSRLQDIDPNSKEALEIGSALEALDKLCAK